MQNTTIPTDLTIVILLAASAFIGVAVSGFLVFYKFLNYEKERGRRFRVARSKQRDPKSNPKGR